MESDFLPAKVVVLLSRSPSNRAGLQDGVQVVASEHWEYLPCGLDLSILSGNVDTKLPLLMNFGDELIPKDVRKNLLGNLLGMIEIYSIDTPMIPNDVFTSFLDCTASKIYQACIIGEECFVLTVPKCGMTLDLLHSKKYNPNGSDFLVI
jgi:hypothetical protein